MGLNLVIGCHRCRERVWFYRGQLDGLEAFYREHSPHFSTADHEWGDVELSDDQAPSDWVDEYRDVAAGRL